jgi:hypothetical protein
MTKDIQGVVSVAVAHQAMGKEQISLRALYRACRTGDIPAIRIGGRVLIPKAWLTAKLNGSK